MNILVLELILLKHSSVGLFYFYYSLFYSFHLYFELYYKQLIIFISIIYQIIFVTFKNIIFY